NATLSATTHPAEPTPAKYTFDIYANPSCTNDYAVFGINAAAGSSTQANIIAFKNLYAGTNPPGLCGSAPTVYFAYNVGTGTVPAAPVLSIDGTKVAFVENNSASVFHVLTIGTTGSNGTAYNAPVFPGIASTTVSTTSVATTLAANITAAATSL